MSIEGHPNGGRYKKWELSSGGCVFETLSSRIFTIDKQDILVPNVIPRVLLDVSSRLESDELRFTWTISRSKDVCFHFRLNIFFLYYTVESAHVFPSVL